LKIRFFFRNNDAVEQACKRFKSFDREKNLNVPNHGLETNPSRTVETQRNYVAEDIICLSD
jgi:hypothetical protein